MKILAIQFRYLGDAALMTPALRAIREHFPGSTLHLLVAEEIVPLLQHLPGLARVWAFPRRRGRAKPTLSWPVIRALRQEHFDRSVEFGGNDRGAIVSLLCGARQRLGEIEGQIASVEKELAVLEDEMNAPGFFDDPERGLQGGERHASLNGRLEKLYGEWEEVSG